MQQKWPNRDERSAAYQTLATQTQSNSIWTSAQELWILKPFCFQTAGSLPFLVLSAFSPFTSWAFLKTCEGQGRFKRCLLLAVQLKPVLPCTCMGRMAAEPPLCSNGVLPADAWCNALGCLSGFDKLNALDFHFLNLKIAFSLNFGQISFEWSV